MYYQWGSYSAQTDKKNKAGKDLNIHVVQHPVQGPHLNDPRQMFV